MSLPAIKGLGFFAPAMERLFALLQWVSSWFIPIPQSFTARWAKATEDEQLDATRLRAWRIDSYIFLWLALQALLLLLVAAQGLVSERWFTYVVTTIAVVRVVDILQVGVNMSVFNHLRLSTYYVSSIARAIVLTTINYFELMVCFGLIYATRLHALASTVGETLTWPDAFYFSAITQLTVGYGDIRPTGLLKIVVCVQAALGVFFALLIMSRFVAMLPATPTVIRDSSASTEHKNVDAHVGGRDA